MRDLAQFGEGSAPARPRWGRLYGIALSAAAALLLVHLVASAPALRMLLSLGAIAAAFGAMARWVAANRAALDQVDWCACASSTITVRELRSRPRDVRNGDQPGPRAGRDDEAAPRRQGDALATEPTSALQ